MLKECQKTSVIKAEKVTKDNVWDLKAKYELEHYYFVNRDATAPYFIFVAGSYKPVYWGDWIATGTDGKHWVIKGEDFQEYYKEVMEKSTTDFERLLYELQYKCRRMSPNLVVKWNYIHEDKIHHASVGIGLKTDNKIHVLAHCLGDNGISNQPQIRVLYRECGNSAIARYIVCALNALAGFADEWQKLEERHDVTGTTIDDGVIDND